ncbi:hypothetical protein FA95DRAFT_1679706 [Auriscalpium vulgare]|uniref:Uncharacterized protein n=1 Tax=Auriscalpium vulgare TaxID=40419 RepID=A0ACB8RRT6_9AGAM|nr:hypothetical protein FA95DRAFT_1679706 [Auriscalpium vulgare]
MRTCHIMDGHPVQPARKASKPTSTERIALQRLAPHLFHPRFPSQHRRPSSRHNTRSPLGLTMASEHSEANAVPMPYAGHSSAAPTVPLEGPPPGPASDDISMASPTSAGSLALRRLESSHAKTVGALENNLADLQASLKVWQASLKVSQASLKASQASLSASQASFQASQASQAFQASQASFFAALQASHDQTVRGMQAIVAVLEAHCASLEHHLRDL